MNSVSKWPSDTIVISVSGTSANKKLRLLENLQSDDKDGNGSTNSSKDDDSSTFRIMQEVTAYLGPRVLMEDEKMSAIPYWRRHAHTIRI